MTRQDALIAAALERIEAEQRRFATGQLHLTDIAERTEELARRTRYIAGQILAILNQPTPPAAGQPVTCTIHVVSRFHEGATMSTTTPTVLTAITVTDVGDTAIAVITDAFGNQVTDAPPVAFTTDSSADLTVDPSTGVIVPTGPTAAAVSISVTNSDGSPLSWQNPLGVAVPLIVVPWTGALLAGPPATATVAVVAGA